MFAITYNGIYMARNHREIILFDTYEEAQSFAINFFNFAKMKAASDGSNPSLMAEIMMISNFIFIEEFDYPQSDCKTVNFKDLEK